MSATPLGDQHFPGDAGAVEELAHKFTSMAAALKGQVEALQGHLAGVGSWQGSANDAFRNTVEPLPDNLYHAEQRYRSAASWLTPYASTLRSAKLQAQQLVEQMQGAQQRIRAAQSGLQDRHRYEAAERHRVQSDPAGGPERPWTGPNHQAALNNANGEFGDLQRRLNALHNAFDDCASQTAGGLIAAAELAKDLGGIKGWLEHRVADFQQMQEKFSEFMDKYGWAALEALSSALAVVGGALTLAAFIPVIGPFIGAVGTVLSVASVAVDLALVLGGRKSFGAWALSTALALTPLAFKGAGAGLLTRAGAKEATNALRPTQTAQFVARGAKQSASRFDEAIGASFTGAKNAVLGREPLAGIKMLHLVPGSATPVLTGGAAQQSIQKVFRLSPWGTKLYVTGEAAGRVNDGKGVLDGLEELFDLGDVGTPAGAQ